MMDDKSHIPVITHMNMFNDKRKHCIMLVEMITLCYILFIITNSICMPVITS